jgi:Protein of unknown function DUF262
VSFQPPVPVERTLREIHRRAYVLPAIQREFVWSTEQIRMLFDSLLRGYPIGSFLFWNVEVLQAAQFTFYDFIRDYHEKDNPYAPAITIPQGHGVVAILDGQQRLTALNIGLHGSHAERQPRKWASNPDAYPKKRLHLDLLGEVPDQELGMQYDFRFLTDAEAAIEADDGRRWYRVGDVLALADSGPAIMAELEARSLQGAKPFQTLYDLYRGIREVPMINYYSEESQDPDKVLDIFVRVNSQATTLSYSDLLPSMATNQWQELDAREEVRSLLSTLNGGSTPFNFSKDVLLKAGLTLIDARDIGFKVSNFTQENMSMLEKRWGEVRPALIVARDLLESFGFSERSLSAESVIVPLAYYACSRGLGSSYVTSSAQAADRQAVRRWVVRSQMKRGIWGSGLDTLLGRLREAIRTHGMASFPVDEIEAAMARMGKSLKFDEAEVAELCDLSYGRPRTFSTLAMLYPGLDLTKQFHEDHIFARSRFTRARLTKAGIPQESVDDYLELACRTSSCLPASPIPRSKRTSRWNGYLDRTSQAQRCGRRICARTTSTDSPWSSSTSSTSTTAGASGSRSAFEPSSVPRQQLAMPKWMLMSDDRGWPAPDVPLDHRGAGRGY